MGLQIDVVSPDYSVARIRGEAGALTICKAFIGHDNMAAVSAMQDKLQAHRLLTGAGIPVPLHRRFGISTGKAAADDSTPIFEFASRHYPVVLKPTHGSRGQGVYVGIGNDQQLAFALSHIKTSWTYPASRDNRKSFLVEEQLTGGEYRVLLCAGVVVEILRKFTGSVVGNGRDTVKDLIESENRRRGDHEAPISDLSRIRTHLALTGLRLKSVPAAGQRVTLDSTCYLPTGGSLTRVGESEVAPEQLELFRKVARVSGLHVAGIDYFCGNIARPWRDTRCALIEVNAGTSSIIHYLAEPGPDLAPARRVVELCLDAVDSQGTTRDPTPAPGLPNQPVLS